MANETGEWQPVFVYTTYVDSDAIMKPWLKARGEHTQGPYGTYEEAERAAQHRNCTHYIITKMTVKAGMTVPLLSVEE
jgi:hypothetical protein